MQSADVVIVGSGIAGLATALSCGRRQVTLLTTDQLGHDGASHLAQGGLAAAIGPHDSPRQHARDTLAAASGHADPEAVRILTSESPATVAWLEQLGACFDYHEGHLRLGREAAHSHHRIVHAGGDASGREVMRALTAAAAQAPSINTVQRGRAEQLAVSAGRVVGLWWRNDRGQRQYLAANDVVLATGGIGGLFAKTTAPEHLCGHGLALARWAGAHLADLEFVQFHPTALDTGQTGQLPLLTEALRGAGATLVDASGHAFMRRHHRAADLAPRDAVARAIVMTQRDGQRVYLDATSIGAEFPSRFPTAWANCQQHRFDPRRQVLPVTPAVHYHMGGIAVNRWGQSRVRHLWACGEVACTGVHGANRLASNSLVEGLVFGRRLGQALARNSQAGCHLDPPPDTGGHGGTMALPLKPLRSLMWEHVGVLRSSRSLQQAVKQIERWRLSEEWDVTSTAMLTVASAIAAAAQRRSQSLGAHWLERRSA